VLFRATRAIADPEPGSARGSAWGFPGGRRLLTRSFGISVQNLNLESTPAFRRGRSSSALWRGFGRTTSHPEPPWHR